MARSPKDERYNEYDMHNTWNYHPETAEKCAPRGLNERPAHTSGIIPDNSVYGNANFVNDVYINKHPYNGDAAPNKDDKIPFNNVPNVSRMDNQNYGNAMLNLGNGQLVRVYYDENNQQLIFPMTGQYELFNHNQGVRDTPLPNSQPSHLFTLNQEYSMNNVHMQAPNIPNPTFNHETNTQAAPQTSNFLKEVLGNWEPNSSGTYSPFGQNYPLNHPDAPTLNLLQTNPMAEAQPTQGLKVETSPKRNESSPLADNTKKRIVAEVKPMRPSYSDVLAKKTKNNSQTEATRRVKPANIELKPSNKINSKMDKPTANFKHMTEENKQKSEKKTHTNTISSGSESGDINTDDTEKLQKPNKRSKNKRNITKRWPSLDDITNEEDTSFNIENESQFVFIENQSEKPIKKDKKDKAKNIDKTATNDNSKEDIDDNESQFVFQESQTASMKVKKKKDTRIHHKISKPVPDKKKVGQNKMRRSKPGYVGLAQNYLEHWGGQTWKALVWFFYIVSDICGMSIHLSFDLCTSVFTQTYVSSQAVWRSTKDWVYKIKDNKFLLYIDRKFGHTRLGFWRKLKWFKKDCDSDNGNDSTKLDSNIPLPATGEEAMKRLLACKGKDPYSILGVSTTCTDEDIKRYYRRQAFLVHPDKNQQPGAEEAFKILQHAFHLIGEPERRSSYARRAHESRSAEAAWGELSALLAQLHDKMEFAANTIRCTNCGRRHKRVLTDRPCYAARYCAQCKIRHSAKEGDIWAESSMFGLLVMYYACMDGAVYQITQWASCQKKNLKQLRPDCHVVQYRIVLGNKAPDARAAPSGHDPNLEEFLNNLYSKSAPPPPPRQSAPEAPDKKKRKKSKV